MNVYSTRRKKEIPRPLLLCILVIVLSMAFFSYRSWRGNKEAPLELGEKYAFEAKKEVTGSEGALLAGKESQLYDFTVERYQEALSSDKLVVVYFYASWCPICQQEFPQMEAAFNEMNNPNVIGFRVHFNDRETGSAERSLAIEHGVSYQHTKLFIKNNQRILKSLVSWEKSKYIQEVNAFFAENP